jgi:hypothetical protein
VSGSADFDATSRTPYILLGVGYAALAGRGWVLGLTAAGAVLALATLAGVAIQP